MRLPSWLAGCLLSMLIQPCLKHRLLIITIIIITIIIGLMLVQPSVLIDNDLLSHFERVRTGDWLVGWLLWIMLLTPIITFSHMWHRHLS